MSWTVTPQQKTDPDALAYLAEVERADGQALESGVRDAVIAFVTGCKTDGLWSSIDYCLILSGARSLAGALIPLKGGTPQNNGFASGDYNRKTGLKGDGSTKYLNTNYPDNFNAQNNIHIVTYASEAATGSVAGYVYSDGNVTSGFLKAGSDLYFRGRSNNGKLYSGSGSSTGYMGIKRQLSTEIKTVLGAGSELVTTENSSAPTGQTFVIHCARSSGNVLNAFSNGRLNVVSIGAALDLAAYRTRINNLVDAFAAAIP